MKYISIGGWFSLEYPPTWREFEDTEESFLFYDPDEWTGNFRISASKDRSDDYGRQCIEQELKGNPAAARVEVGPWECAYGREDFRENGASYTAHWWVTGRGNLSFACSFTVPEGGDKQAAEAIIRSLQIRPDSSLCAKEIIPVRVVERLAIDEACEWVSSLVKKRPGKEFDASEEDVDSLQEVMDSGRFQPAQRPAWENIGLAFGAILANEMEGMEWVTVVDGAKEYPALQFMESEMVVNPKALAWDSVRKGRPCNLRSEFARIRREAEAVLDGVSPAEP